MLLLQAGMRTEGNVRGGGLGQSKAVYLTQTVMH